jgi:activator of HSP90 ATPase
MTKTITQTVTFKGATAKDLYGIYMNSKKHAAATGAPAEMTKKVGEKWKAHKGELRGTNLLLKANKTIVQTWRAKGWKSDSVLTLQFEDTTEGCELTMVHALVPEAAAGDIKSGWTKMYWKPFKSYLKANN